MILTDDEVLSKKIWNPLDIGELTDSHLAANAKIRELEDNSHAEATDIFWAGCQKVAELEDRADRLAVVADALAEECETVWNWEGFQREKKRADRAEAELEETNAMLIKDFLEENFATFQGFISTRGIDEQDAEIIIDSINSSKQGVIGDLNIHTETENLLDGILYCDLRTEVGVEKARALIRRALKKALPQQDVPADGDEDPVFEGVFYDMERRGKEGTIVKFRRR
jgi:hypothetical protein